MSYSGLFQAQDFLNFSSLDHWACPHHWENFCWLWSRLCIFWTRLGTSWDARSAIKCRPPRICLALCKVHRGRALGEHRWPVGHGPVPGENRHHHHLWACSQHAGDDVQHEPVWVTTEANNWLTCPSRWRGWRGRPSRSAWYNAPLRNRGSTLSAGWWAAPVGLPEGPGEEPHLHSHQEILAGRAV